MSDLSSQEPSTESGGRQAEEVASLQLQLMELEVEIAADGIDFPMRQLFDTMLQTANTLTPEKKIAQLGQMIMLHVMNTLPILPAADELELSNRGCIMLPGGALTQPGCAPTMCPAVSFAVQSGKGHCKGIGVRAEENIQPGTKVGVYAGESVMNSEIGRPYVSLKHPSRYVAVVQGNIPALIQVGASKCSVNAQLTEVRDWRWAKINSNIGPFLNAPDDDDPHDEVNCTLDRCSLWVDSDGLKWMWMVSCKFIPKESFLQWKYDRRAGPGGFWKFS
mmetsp:Transcript_56393/g.117859  ORF Transcript_56393/g.117859 Transcript_56393/m.117859 type:complete len:277 (-) Transcript_56393:80-910(-)